MLFVSVWKSVVNIQHVPPFSLTHSLKICLVSIGVVRLDRDESYVENGPTLSLNSTPCFLLPIIIKCNKFTTFKHCWTLVHLHVSLIKDMVKHKVALVKKATPIIIEVINIWSFVLKPLTLETKALEVIMLDHILVM